MSAGLGSKSHGRHSTPLTRRRFFSNRMTGFKFPKPVVQGLDLGLRGGKTYRPSPVFCCKHINFRPQSLVRLFEYGAHRQTLGG